MRQRATPISGRGRFPSVPALQYELPLCTVSSPATWFRVGEDERLLGTKLRKKERPCLLSAFLMFLFSISLHATVLVHVRTRLVLTQVPSPHPLSFSKSRLSSKYLTPAPLHVATGWFTLRLTCSGVCSNYRGHPKEAFSLIKVKSKPFYLSGAKHPKLKRVFFEMVVCKVRGGNSFPLGFFSFFLSFFPPLQQL